MTKADEFLAYIDEAEILGRVIETVRFQTIGARVALREQVQKGQKVLVTTTTPHLSGKVTYKAKDKVDQKKLLKDILKAADKFDSEMFTIMSKHGLSIMGPS